MANGDDLNAKKQMNDLEREYAQSLSNVFDLESQILRKVDEILQRKKELLLTEEVIQETVGKGRSLTEEEFDNLVEIHRERKGILETTVKQVGQDRIVNKTLSERFNTLTAGIQTYFNYLMESDKAMKEMILDFGISGEKAEMIRTSLESSAIKAARLGVSVKELTGFYRAYGEEVGRVVTLGDEQLKSMAALEKGTGLATGQAARLAGQFELIGMDLIQTVKTVEGIMDTTERMGVNTTKVLKAVGENFKRLQTYNFKEGVAGMGEMAAFAEKFKIDLNASLGAAEDFRSLEGAIEGAANLQILGGEFARLADPMQMLYESRNDLDAFNKRISEMTKGMATLVETEDGFQFQLASPMARDMLARAGEQLGLSVEQMSEMAIQQEKINKMRQDIIGSGYNEEQQNLIEGMAQLNAETGSFFVMIGNKRRDIASLTADELKLLKGEQASLEARAKAAQTFDEQFQIFVEELKAVGLPLLEGINEVLGFIRKGLDGFTSIFEDSQSALRGTMKYVGIGLAGVMGIKGVLTMLGGIPKLISGMSEAVKGIGGGILGSGGAVATGAAGAGIGAGIAALGAGAGLKLAADGISNIASSLEKLPEEKIEALKDLTKTIGIFIGATAGIGVASALLGASAVPLIAFGGAVALIGAGIGAAAWGIGQMSEGMATLMESASPEDVMKLAGSMTALAGGASLVANPLSLVGLAAMTGSIATMSQYSDDMEKIGNAFANMSVVLSGTKSDFEDIANAVKTISSAELTRGNIFQELTTLLKQPLKVQFAEQEVGMNMNVNLNIDKNKLIAALNLNKNVPVMTKMAQDGQSSG